MANVKKYNGVIDIDARVLLASAYFKIGYYERAINLCRVILEEYPNDRNALLILARISFK
jgi:cytochrome c-type biogenesis protein CcmH/NrfG